MNSSGNINTNLQQQRPLTDSSHPLQSVDFCNQDSVQQLTQRKAKKLKSKSTSSLAF